MQALWDSAPFLGAMLLLVCVSAFFSASEAALFYLDWSDRRALATGTRAQRLAERLLRDPDRLLFAVLFWNLVVNITYFALGSIVGLRLDQHPTAPPSTVAVFAAGSLLLIIFLSEMMPKTFAVMRRRWLAGTVGIPLSAAVAALDPIMPLLRGVNLLSKRLLWPSLSAEAPLELADLERAIELSTEDSELMAQEQTVLRNIVYLSDLQVREWMRPRKMYRPFRPPISQADLRGHSFPSGYLLVADEAGNDVVAALALRQLGALPKYNLQLFASPTSIVPWCASVAAALEKMQAEGAEVAAVVNELGETIGVITFSDILDAVFTLSPDRGERLLKREPIRAVRPQVWHVEGVTNLRRLARHFQIKLPKSHHSTLAGVVEEALGRLPVTGDRCDWGPLSILVLPAEEQDGTRLEISLRPDKDARP